MFKKTESKRSKPYAGFAGIAALALLTACGGDDPAQEEEPVDPGVEQDDPMQEDPMQQDPAEDPADPADDLGDEGNEVEGAGADDATSTVGLAGSTVSWAL